MPTPQQVPAIPLNPFITTTGGHDNLFRATQPRAQAQRLPLLKQTEQHTSKSTPTIWTQRQDARHTKPSRQSGQETMAWIWLSWNPLHIHFDQELPLLIQESASHADMLDTWDNETAPLVVATAHSTLMSRTGRVFVPTYWNEPRIQQTSD